VRVVGRSPVASPSRLHVDALVDQSAPSARSRSKPAIDWRYVACATIGTVPPHRLHVVPWLRGLGDRVFITDWLAITVGRDIWSWRPLDEVELAHELCHVRQWQRYGLAFVLRYGIASLFALWTRGHWYRDNAYEVEARGSAARVAAARRDQG
jgi:hypothetical protein